MHCMQEHCLGGSATGVSYEAAALRHRSADGRPDASSAHGIDLTAKVILGVVAQRGSVTGSEERS